MKNFRLIIITIILSGAVFVAGSLAYGALTVSTGASAGSLYGYPPVAQPTPVVQAQPTPVATVAPTATVQRATIAPTVQAQLTDDQRITQLEARVSALEARVK